MSLNFDEQNLKKQLQIAVGTVLVTIIGYLYGKLLDRAFAGQTPVFSLLQLGLFGIFSGYAPLILQKFGYSQDVITQSMSVYTAAALFGQPRLLDRFSSLITFI